MDWNNLSPYVRVAWDNTIKAPFTLSERVIFDYELLFIKKGHVKVIIEDDVYYGIPGDIFLFRPMQPHSIELLNNEDLHQPHIHFDLYYQENSPQVRTSFQPLDKISDQERTWFREDVIPNMDEPLPSQIRLNKPFIIEQLMNDIIVEVARKFPHYEVAVKGLFTQLWVQLLRENYWKNNALLYSQWTMLERIKNYISHQSHQEITLDEISNFGNISKYHLCRLFKEAYGFTPIQYHVMIRLEKAKQLVQFTDLPLTIIAEKLGFNSIHAFSRAFRKQEGVPPSFYRKRSK